MNARPDHAGELRGKLVKVLGRLGSEHDGERAAAGLLASRMVAAAGLTWERLLAPALAFNIGTATAPARPAPRAWRAAPTRPRFNFRALTPRQCNAAIKAMAPRLSEPDREAVEAIRLRLYREPHRGITTDELRMLNRLWRQVMPQAGEAPA